MGTSGISREGGILERGGGGMAPLTNYAAVYRFDQDMIAALDITDAVLKVYNKATLLSHPISMICYFHYKDLNETKLSLKLVSAIFMKFSFFHQMIALKKL